MFNISLLKLKIKKYIAWDMCVVMETERRCVCVCVSVEGAIETHR